MNREKQGSWLSNAVAVLAVAATITVMYVPLVAR